MPNSEASSQEPKSTKNPTEETVYEGLNNFFKDFEITPEKLEISYPEGKNAKGVFEEISSLIKEGKKGVANIVETPENSQSPSEKIAEIKDSGIKDYRVEAFANCVLKVFESKEKDQDSKNAVLEKLTSAFSFLGDEKTKEEGKETNKEIDQFTKALSAISEDQQIEDGLKQALVGSFKDAFMKKKEPEPNKENSTEPKNNSPETTNSQDEEKAKTKDKTKDNPKEHFLDNYNVNYQSAGAAAAKLSIAVALCFVAPPIGFLLSAGFCAATPSWGQNAITKKKDHEIGNGFLDKEAPEKQEKEQEPEIIKKALDETIEKVVKGKENPAEPTLEPGKVENTNEAAASPTTQVTATTENPAVNSPIIENPAASTSNGAQEVQLPAAEASEIQPQAAKASEIQPQANTNLTTEASATQTRAANEAATTQTPANTNSIINGTPAANLTTQDPPIEIGSINLKLDDIDPAKAVETTQAEVASSGTTHAESTNAINSLSRELSSRLVNLENSLINFFNKDKTSDLTQMTHNPLLNDIDENSTSQNNGETLVIVGGFKEKTKTINNRFEDTEVVKSEEVSSPTPVEGENNSKKEEGKSNLSSIIPKDLVKSFSNFFTKPDGSSNYLVSERPPLTPNAKNSSQSNQGNGL